MKNYKIYLYTKFVGIPQVQKNYPVKPCRLIKDGDYDKYIEELFDENRIKTRLKFFEELTLKSILSQTYKNFEWIIFISHLLPQKYKEYIENIKNTDSRIKIIEVNQIKIDNDYLITLHQPQEEFYISCRLDDDDALCADYFKILNEEFNNDNTLEIFGSINYLMVLYDEKYDKFLSSTNKGKYKYLISAGLSCKNRHIYSIGSHSLIHTEKKYKFKTIEELIAIQSAGEHTYTKRFPNHDVRINLFDIDFYLNKNLNSKLLFETNNT